MAIKRREKPLTPQEAINLAKKELYPYWYNSEPLMAGVRQGTAAKAYPLDAALQARPWLICFIDLTELSARDVIHYVRSWGYRYEAQKLGIIFSLRCRYSFEKGSDWGRTWSSIQIPTFVGMLDQNKLLFDSFQMSTYPGLVLLNQGQVIFQKSGPNWFKGTETDLQRFFRRTDPGLPLFPEMGPDEPMIEDLPSIEISSDSQDLVLSGQWTREEDRVWTQDPSATASFRCPGKRLGILAQAISKDDTSTSEVILEMGMELAKDTPVGADLFLDPHSYESVSADPIQRRRGSITLRETRTYHLFKKLPASNREVTLRFPAAAQVPVAIYGIRFGN